MPGPRFPTRRSKRPQAFIRFIEPLEARQLLAGDVRFGVIGDFGANTPEEAEMAKNRLEASGIKLPSNLFQERVLLRD